MPRRISDNKLTLSMPVEFQQRLAKLAELDYETVSHEVRRAVKEYLENREYELKEKERL